MKTAVCLLLLALSLTACDMAPPVEQVGVADLTSPLVNVLEVSTGVQGDQKLSSEEEKRKKEFGELLDKFMARKGDVFQSPETDRHLNGIEEMATFTERSFEVIDLYKSVVDKEGPGHYVAPRLAWAYLNLGQIKMARKVTNASMKARPEDARNYFIDGYLLGRENELNAQVVAQVYKSWSRALELDPNLERLYGVRAQIVRDRLDQMKKLLDAEEARTGRRPTPSAPSSQPSAPSSAPSSAQALDLPTLLTKADALLADGNGQDAFKSYTRALQASPNNMQAQVGQALSAGLVIGGGDPARVRTLAEKVAAREDLQGPQLVALGQLFAKDLGMPDKAIALWQRAQKVDPDLSARENLEQRIQNAQTQAKEVTP